MADDRAARMARIERMERIRALESGNTEQAPAPKNKVLVDKAAPEGREVQAGIEGFGQGATMGYMPQINAGVESAIEGAGNLKDRIARAVGAKSMMSQDAQLQDEGFTLPEQSGYTEKRDSFVKRGQELEKENPWSYGAGQVGGALATSMALPGSVATKGATLIPKGVAAARMGKTAATLAKPAAQKLIAAGLTGGAMGLAQNPGDKEGVVDPLQMGDRAMNGVTGAGTGMLPTAIAEDMLRLGPGLKKLAGTEAFKALGPYARKAALYADKGKAADIGNTALDEGILGWIPRGYNTIKKRAGEVARKRGGELEGYVGALDDEARALTDVGEGIVAKGHDFGTAGLDRKAIAQSIREDMISPHTDIKSIARKNKEVESIVQAFENGDDSVIPVLEAWGKKKAVGGEINWGRLKHEDVPIAEQVNKKLYGKMNQGIEDAAEFIESQPNKNLLPGQSPKQPGQFKKLNAAVHGAKVAEELSGKRVAHEMAKQLTLPVIGGTFGLGSGEDMGERIQNALTGMAGGYALRKGMQIKPQITAQLARLASKGVSKMKAPQNPWVLPGIANELTRGEDNGKEK